MTRNFIFSWKSGLLTALVFVIVGIGFFALVGSKLDYSCTYTTPHSTGCRIYNGFSTIAKGYGDFWLQFFAPRCVGDSVPDDCIGPGVGAMFFTLVGAGLLIGGFSHRPSQKKTSNT